jgi:hypothetical protein
MGDRGNVFVVTDFQQETKRPLGVVFYSHNSGYDLARRVQVALAKRWRWSDESYLARIIFDGITEGQQGGETGYGISTQAAGDAEYPIIWVEPSDGKETGHVSFRPNAYNHCNPKGDSPAPFPECRWTFEEYLKLTETDFETLYQNRR